MSSEILRYWYIQDGLLVIQLSGGGAAAQLKYGMPAGEVIGKLRHLADMLEHTVMERSTTTT